MDAPPLARSDDSILLMVDMQTRLAAAMEETPWSGARDNARLLARGAGELELPVIVTRQYPQGLGDTVPEIAAALPDHAVMLDKTCFPATDADEVAEALRMTGRQQVVVCGMETHVCVLQTVAGLVDHGYRPFVAADAVCSRKAAHSDNALRRIRGAGISVTNGESVLFEWLRDAGHDRFKAISALIK